MTVSAAPAPPWRIEVFRRPAVNDPEGVHVQTAAAQLGLGGTLRARLGRGYLLPGELEDSAVQQLVSQLLADPVLDDARTYAPGEAPPAGEARRVLVARRPGVMDAVARTLERAARKAELLPTDVSGPVQTFSAWEFTGDIDEAALLTLASQVLGNVTIDTLNLADESLHYGHPGATPDHGVVHVPLLEASDEELQRLSKDGMLSLNLIEMQCIKDHYKDAGRNPTSAELETLAQTWSEHCQHKTFRGIIEMDGEVIDNLLKTTIAAATHELDKPWCISVFHDNAGIVEFEPDLVSDKDGGKGWDLAFKVETHNHPSAIDPYGGAGTGIGGVIRDILGVGKGARPIANTNAFFVGPPDLPEEKLPKGSLPPARVLRGVVSGVRDYGNRMGIPTVSGGVWFHEGYVANPLVYAGTVGLMPRSAATKEVIPGDIILVVGGRTGRDGIHGATFSSIELDEDSETTSAASVQIGDPITEKKVCEGLLRARDAGLFRGLTDCGAGGLSSAVGEMGAECGAEVDLALVPLKYPGLSPEETWISEAQERMVLGVPPEDLEACIAVFADEDVEATAIGTFTDTGRLVLRHGDLEVADLDMHFLHEGTPRPTRKATWKNPEIVDSGAPTLDDASATLLEMLGRDGVASKEWIVRQYDHEVQGTSVIKAMCGVEADAPSDGVVLKPLPDSKKGVALGNGANPRYGRLDPRSMAEAVIDEAMRNVVCSYGDPERTCLLDNFSWGNCDLPDRLGSLVEAAKGCYNAAMGYSAPFISGKDSLNNEYRVGDTTLSIPPTLYVSSMAMVPNVASVVSSDAKKAGNLICLVGITKPELGGSELHAMLDLDGGTVPRPDFAYASDTFKRVHAAMKLKQIVACHDLSEGGLAVAVAEMCMGGGLGADLDLGTIDHDEYPAGYDTTTTLLFSESCSRFLVEIEPGKKYNLQNKLMGIAVTPMGRFTTSGHLRIKGDHGRPVLDVTVDQIRTAFHSGFSG
ncbi:MAG: phosphoribosylformylglycinamidine synthase II [Planctomycetota bacterium]|jgi:phosphoribosylformylglycinamidine synthase II